MPPRGKSVSGANSKAVSKTTSNAASKAVSRAPSMRTRKKSGGVSRKASALAIGAIDHTVVVEESSGAV